MRRIAGLLALLVVLNMPLLAQAQDENLLEQGDFEAGFTGRGRPDLNIPSAWGLWLADRPRHEEWQNRPDKVYAFPHTTPPEVHAGRSSLNLSGGYITYTAAVYQQVNVPDGAYLRASAWAWLHTCHFPRDAQNQITGGVCDSQPDFGAFVRVGIDPNGGINPADTDIVWSQPLRPHDEWAEVAVETTARSSLVTVFLYAAQSTPPDLNNTYWDDAALVITEPNASAQALGSGGLTRASGSLPVPQTPGPDGSLIHVVQPGDTLDGIALVYGVRRSDLLVLNTFADPRALRVGDTITVREAE